MAIVQGSLPLQSTSTSCSVQQLGFAARWVLLKLVHRKSFKLLIHVSDDVCASISCLLCLPLFGKEWVLSCDNILHLLLLTPFCLLSAHYLSKSLDAYCSFRVSMKTSNIDDIELIWTEKSPSSPVCWAYVIMPPWNRLLQTGRKPVFNKRLDWRNNGWRGYLELVGSGRPKSERILQDYPCCAPKVVSKRPCLMMLKKWFPPFCSLSSWFFPWYAHHSIPQMRMISFLLGFTWCNVEFRF